MSWIQSTLQMTETRPNETWPASSVWILLSQSFQKLHLSYPQENIHKDKQCPKQLNPFLNFAKIMIPSKFLKRVVQ